MVDDRFRRLPRHERLRRDIQRAKDSPVPTWAYAVGLVAMIAAVYALVTIFGR